MNAPADTLNYMIAGYTVVFVVLIIYLASLVIRFRNLKQDEAMLEEIEQKKK
jgi:hypothetical protein